MEIRILNCGCCGAPLELLQSKGLYACRHCDALHVSSDDRGSICGQKLDRIDRMTQQIAERLEGIDFPHRADCRHYLVLEPPGGRRSNPGATLPFAFLFCVVGVLLCMIGIIASGLLFLTGVACILIGVVDVIIDNSAAKNERWRRLIARYHKRPQSVDVVRRPGLN